MWRLPQQLLLRGWWNGAELNQEPTRPHSLQTLETTLPEGIVKRLRLSPNYPTTNEYIHCTLPAVRTLTSYLLGVRIFQLSARTLEYRNQLADD